MSNYIVCAYLGGEYLLLSVLWRPFNPHTRFRRKWNFRRIFFENKIFSSKMMDFRIFEFEEYSSKKRYAADAIARGMLGKELPVAQQWGTETSKNWNGNKIFWSPCSPWSRCVRGNVQIKNITPKKSIFSPDNIFLNKTSRTVQDESKNIHPSVSRRWEANIIESVLDRTTRFEEKNTYFRIIRKLTPNPSICRIKCKKSNEITTFWYWNATS